MLPKEKSCVGCVLETKGRGWVPPAGPKAAKILLVGEAPGAEEALAGVPFVGPAGALLNRALWMIGKDKAEFRIANSIQCGPPGNWLDGAPWESASLAHCRPNLDAVLNQPGVDDEYAYKVVVTLGATALRSVLRLPRGKGYGVKEWHGTVSRDPHDRFWVVPTFHPSFLQRGANNLFGTFLFDLQRAIEVASEGWTVDTPSLLCDPPLAEWNTWVKEVLDRVAADPESVWLAVDIETPDKERQADEGELGFKDRSHYITRVNFAVGPDEGVTVPFVGGYVDGIRALLSSGAPLSLWNARYDIPRLRLHGCPPVGRVLDWMWGWHVLQSDTPRGLGFVSPFYSNIGAWKHLSGSDAVKYAALDGVQTWRVADGIAADLQKNGQWETFLNHVVALDEIVLEPAEEVGLLVDKEEIETLRSRLATHAMNFYSQIQELVPEELLGWHPKEGWRKEPKEGTIEALNVTRAANGDPLLLPGYHKREKSALVKICKSCGVEEVTKSHRCADRDKIPDIETVERTLEFFYAKVEFNPASPQQILSYVKHHKHKPGKDRKSGKETVDKLTLEGLAWSSKQERCREFYNLCLQRREVKKVLGTYVEGTLRRLADGNGDGRLHGTFTHKPSTLRLSMVNPNLQNVVADRGGKESLSAGFKKCLVAAPGCKLIEADFGGIEAVLTGWFAHDPTYIRLATLGVHAYVTAHDVGQPASLSWSDADLGAHFKEIKKHYDKEYQRCKRVVHGVSYGLSAFGMHERYPKIFPSVASAQKVVELFFSLAPSIPKFQRQVREIAHKQHYLGGEGHPFHYKHWFWDVYSYRKITDAARVARERRGEACSVMNGQSYAIQLGEDGKRCVAFYPQSTAAGVGKEAGLRLHTPDHPSYIGNAFYGRTPTRAFIHDSFLLEVPDELVDSVVEKVVREMTRPIPELPCPAEWGIGDYLHINVAVKVGQNWGEMEEINTGWVNPGVAYDSTIWESDDEEEEE